jgi:DNA polymerase-3 subunit chi
VTRVDFYVLENAAADARLLLAARLCEKAHRQGHRIYLHAPDEALARHMDDLLWTYRPESFLRHGLIGAADSETIGIGWQEHPEGHDDVLINLGLAVVPFFSRFHRVAELVSRAPDSLPALRQNWRYYKDRGYPLHKHDLSL